MKNLKRVLSLALAGTMLTGMMAMGASAANKDFTDADEIVNVEAVDVMSTLGVLKGKDTGAFDPKATVTRAEMAKIITVMLNGGNDPTLGSTSTVMFTDIQNHWAKSYIQYCANLGIIAGQGDGTFAPDAPVTGAAAAKMLLVALGYDADIAGYQGADWDLNVNRDANEAKLYDEIKTIDTSAGLSRDNTAQMAYNALEAKIMERTDHKVVGTGEVSYTYEQSKTTTFLNKYFDAKTFIGTYMGNDKTEELTKGHIKVTGKLDTDDGESSGQKDRDANFPSDMGIENIGEEVKVIYKEGKGGRDGRPDKNDTIYGVFNTGKTEVINDILANVKDNKAAEQKIKIGSEKYELADEVTVYYNYQSTGTPYKIVTDASGNVTDDSALVGTTKANSKLVDELQDKTGDTIKAVTDPETDKINAIYVTTTKIAAVTAKNSTKITLNNGVGTLTIADNEVEDGLKKGDVVVATTYYKAKATDEGAYTMVKKAETVSGKVDGYDKQKTVTVDGTKYKIYGEKALFDTIPEASNIVSNFDPDEITKNTYIGEEVTLYMVNGYVGAAIQTSKSASNYSVVLEVKDDASTNSAFSKLQMQVMDATGTKTIINVSDDSDDVDDDGSVTNADYGVGDIVTYYMDGNEAVVSLEAAYADNVTAKYSDSTKAIGPADGKLVVTDTDCVIFVQTKKGVTWSAGADKIDTATTWKAFNIRNLKGFTAEQAGYTVLTDKISGKVVAAVANTAEGQNPAGATENTVWGIVSNVGGRVKDYYTYTVQSNGETYTVNSKDGGIKKGNLVKFALASDNNYAKDAVEVISSISENAQVVYTKEADKDTLTFFTSKTGPEGEFEGAGQTTLALDDDCAIVYVDVDNSESMAEASIDAFDSVTGYKNALIVTKLVDGETVIAAIFVETSNESDIVTGASDAMPANTTGAKVKELPDGTYIPADKKFATSEDDVAGEAKNNVIVKFTVGAEKTTKVSLSVKAGKTEMMPNGEAKEFTVDWAKESAHFIFFNVYGGEGGGTDDPDLSEGGVFTVTVTDVTNNEVLYSGSINVAPKG